MAKYEVVSIFKDGTTGQVHYPKEEIDITEAQAKKFPAGIIKKPTASKSAKEPK